MTCRRCGRNNLPNARRCTYCGTPLIMPNKKNNQKQTESVIVALIIVLVLLLIIVVGVVIYKNNNPHNVGFGGSGGGSLPSPPFSSNEVKPSETPNNDNSVEQEIEKEISTEQPKQTDEPNTSSEKLSKKDLFLDKADDIEWYSETYLKTAETQLEINSELSIVYKKGEPLARNMTAIQYTAERCYYLISLIN